MSLNEVLSRKAALINFFYESNLESLHDTETAVAVCGKSTAWAERKRWEGNGIAFVKIDQHVRYKKSNVLAWLEKHQEQQSTSENKTPPNAGFMEVKKRQLEAKAKTKPHNKAAHLPTKAETP